MSSCMHAILFYWSWQLTLTVKQGSHKWAVFFCTLCFSVHINGLCFSVQSGVGTIDHSALFYQSFSPVFFQDWVPSGPTVFHINHGTPSFWPMYYDYQQQSEYPSEKREVWNWKIAKSQQNYRNIIKSLPSAWPWFCNWRLWPNVGYWNLITAWNHGLFLPLFHRFMELLKESLQVLAYCFTSRKLSFSPLKMTSYFPKSQNFWND